MTTKRNTSADRGLVTFYGDAFLIPSLLVGEEATLRVALTSYEPSSAGAPKFNLAPQKNLRINLKLSGPEVAVEPGKSGSLYIPVKGESAPAYFSILPKTPGTLSLTITFSQGGQVVGEASLSSQVIAPDPALIQSSDLSMQKVFVEPASAQPIESRITFGRQPPDITLHIQEDGPGYSFAVYTSQPDLAPAKSMLSDAWTVRPAGNPQQILDEIWHQIDSPGDQDRRMPDQDRVTRLGNRLYDLLFPPGFQQWYKTQVHPVVSRRRLTLALICSEPSIPWEAARPYWRQDDGTFIEADFLCQQFVVSRWLPEALPPPDKVPVNRLTVVIRPTKSSFETDEKRYLSGLEQRLPGLEVDLAYDSHQAIVHLAQGEASILHFLTPPIGSDVGSAEDLASFKRTRPLVFVNAHTRDKSNLTLTGLGEWAHTFINAGCSAFVAPAWEVDDQLAYRFAMEFYEQLWRGQRLTEALTRARAAIREQAPDDPAWLAYTLYGHPLAKVYVPQPGEGYLEARFRDLTPGDSLRIGLAYDLEVTLREEAPTWYQGSLTDSRGGPALEDLEVTAGGGGFAVTPGKASLHIGGGTVAFTVTPLRAGSAFLLVRYWRGGTYAGALELPVNVLSGGES